MKGQTKGQMKGQMKGPYGMDSLTDIREQTKLRTGRTDIYPMACIVPRTGQHDHCP